jgi:hypothetical protein
MSCVFVCVCAWCIYESVQLCNCIYSFNARTNYKYTSCQTSAWSQSVSTHTRGLGAYAVRVHEDHVCDVLADQYWPRVYTQSPSAHHTRVVLDRSAVEGTNVRQIAPSPYDVDRTLTVIYIYIYHCVRIQKRFCICGSNFNCNIYFTVYIFKCILCISVSLTLESLWLLVLKLSVSFERQLSHRYNSI